MIDKYKTYILNLGKQSQTLLGDELGPYILSKVQNGYGSIFCSEQ
jgi:hypothetical protein